MWLGAELSLNYRLQIQVQLYHYTWECSHCPADKTTPLLITSVALHVEGAPQPDFWSQAAKMQNKRVSAVDVLFGRSFPSSRLPNLYKGAV